MTTAWLPIPPPRHVARKSGRSLASQARTLYDHRCSVDEIALWMRWPREEVRQALRRRP